MHPIIERCLLDRRQFLTTAGGGLGGLALALLQQKGAAAAVTEGERSDAVKFPIKAKNCIFLYMAGGMSQFDLFSPKPRLNELNGQRPPAELLEGKRFAFLNKETAVLLGTAPSRSFAPCGKSGMLLSNLLPQLSQHADKLCLINSMSTTQFNHHPGQLLMQTGHNLQGHPAMGAWLEYGLGTLDQNFPGYVVMNSSGAFSGGETLWNSGFLPSNHSGVLLRAAGDPILNLNAPAGFSREAERRELDSLSRLNELHRAQMLDPQIAARIENYELSFRMQAEAPAIVDLTGESAATLERYGVNRADPDIAIKSDIAPAAGIYGNFARHCLLARRMVEKGVRFVNIFTGSWDQHQNLDPEMPFWGGLVDQPVAALLQDLEERGLLDETLVVFATEFGRTPLGENRPGFEIVTGRDHHPDSFSVFLAGGGTKGGLTYGETDEIGWSVTKDPVDIADLHATILRLFGIDHLALTYRHLGVDQRLTPLTREARVIDALIA
jgi:uncharacterized protein (DUF1501 family)